MRVGTVRNSIQALVALGLLYAGWRFFRFVSHFVHGTPYVSRPSIVEVFLPISALVGIKHWLTTGVYTTVHPAGLSIFLAVLITAILFHRAVCSWLCPFGLLSEQLERLGEHLPGPTIEPPTGVDYGLRSVKFVVLAFLLKVVFVDFSAQAAREFIHTPFNKIAAVKMLYFWLEPSLLTVSVVGFLVVGSMFVRNFWCRYFCPYGALLGVIGRLSPLAARVSRDETDCVGCGRCTVACPNYVDIESVEEVRAVECTRCCRCIEACPNGSLNLSTGPASIRTRLSPRAIGVGVVLVIVTVAAVAVVTGHWDTGVDNQEYSRLIPRVHELTHDTHL